MQVFFADVLSDGSLRLPPEEAQHCVRVLRKRPGDEIHCIDGKGHYFAGKISLIEKDRVDVQALHQVDDWGEHAFGITLAVSPLHNKDRFEWIIEKAVELGVTAIQPLMCRHTDKYQARYKDARLMTILSSALKQCKRSRMPVLHPAADATPWLRESHSGLRLIASGDAATHIYKETETIAQAQEVTLLIGPEGDFSAEELALAHEAGWRAVSLGNNRLRTETAALMGLSYIKGVKGY